MSSKILAEYENEDTKVTAFRHLKQNKFTFSIEILDLLTDTVEEKEYTGESILEKFDEITFEYDFKGE